MLIVGGSGSVAGGIVGAIVVTLVVEVLRRVGDANEFFGLTNAGLAIIILLTLYFRPQGILGFREPEEILAYRSAPPDPREGGADRVAKRDQAPGTPVLSATDVVKKFSGLTALNGVSITVEAQRISGLIGPNGSGKSTLVNCLTGLTEPDSATIVLADQSIGSEPVWRRARKGLGRTFQTVRLFKEMTVIDNVTVACISSGLSPDRADKRSREILSVMGVGQHGYRAASELPYGDQRRVEIARALALNPRVLLLDEPAAGMNPAESHELLLQLQQVLEQTEIGILLIDHDVALIRSACDSLTVLDYGAVIAYGDPETVLAQPQVAAAYLGWRDQASASDLPDRGRSAEPTGQTGATGTQKGNHNE